MQSKEMSKNTELESSKILNQSTYRTVCPSFGSSLRFSDLSADKKKHLWTFKKPQINRFTKIWKWDIDVQANSVESKK